MIWWKPLPTHHSPWGLVDYYQQLGNDIWVVTTPGHGGLYVGPESAGNIPIEVQQCMTDGSWFEEDCEMPIGY